jgi:hypothetical protein
MAISNISTFDFALGISNKYSADSRQSQPHGGKSTNAISAESGDVLDLSAESQTASDALHSLLDSQKLADLFVDKASLEQSEADLQSNIQNLFAKNGIDTSKKVDLQIGSDGQVIVANDHPQKAQIEQLFKDNPKLRDEFAKYSAQSSLFQAAQESIAFQKAYARDPAAAVAQFSYLFNATETPVVSLSLQNGNCQTFVKYPGGKTVEL